MDALALRPLKGSKLRVGITGGIGSGKSTIARVIAALGIAVYDADSRARALMSMHGELRDGIVTLFGPQAYVDDILNRQHLRQAFATEGMRQKLNALVHPVVEADFEMWAELPRNAPYVLKEAALLIEAGSYKRLDVLVNVTCPVEERIRRIRQRDPQRTEQEIKSIISSQLSDEERTERSDITIANGLMDYVLPQILALHERLLMGRHGHAKPA